jgi:hypothetical protein
MEENYSFDYLFQNYKNIRSDIINIELINKGARDCFLLETKNTVYLENKSLTNIILNYAIKSNLIYTIENEKLERYLISNIYTIESYLKEINEEKIKKKKIIF